MASRPDTQGFLTTMGLVPEEASRAVMAQTDVANAKQVDLEERAFGLVQQGQPAEAQKLLASQEYKTQKQAYTAGMTQLSRLLQQTIDSARAQWQARVLSGVVTAAILTPLLMAGWWFTLRTARRWQRALVQTNEHLNQQSAELERFNNTLDEKVRKRTAEPPASLFQDTPLGEAWAYWRKDLGGGDGLSIGVAGLTSALPAIRLCEPNWITSMLLAC